MVATALVIVIVAVYILMNAACIGFFARPGHRFNPWLHAVIPVLGIIAFVPAWLTSAGIDVLPATSSPRCRRRTPTWARAWPDS